jgi:hypothetical protein
VKPEHVVVVPSTLAFLPAYAGVEDPVADVRRAAIGATAWLVERHPDRISVLAAGARADNLARGVTESSGERVARHLLAETGFSGDVGDGAAGLLVVANGSATRSEKAPGHLDERAAAFDESIGRSLRSADTAALRGVDVALGEELWAFDAPVLRSVGDLEGAYDSEVDYDDDPYGVQYWVVRWRCES